MTYYRLEDDIDAPRRWYLGDVRGVDNWALVVGDVPADLLEPVEVEVDREGRPMDLTFTEVYRLPVVSSGLRAALGDLPGVRFLPARSGSRGDEWFVLVLRPVECVDEARSEFEVFTADDPVRPDLAGTYSAFYELVIDRRKALARGLPMFRVARFLPAVVVDDAVAAVLRAPGLTGVRLTEV